MESYTEERQKEIVDNFFNLMITANQGSNLVEIMERGAHQHAAADLLELTQHLLGLVTFKQNVIEEYQTIYLSMQHDRKKMIQEIQELIADLGT
jgi:hypothetical protein